MVPGTELSTWEVFCLFGYQFTIFVPLCILSVIPSNWVKWFLMLTGWGVSSYYVLLNLWAPFQAGVLVPTPQVSESMKARVRWAVFGSIVVAQFIFSLILKLAFLTFSAPTSMA